MIRIRTPYLLALIACAGFLLFIPFLGVVNLFDWDEANFAEAAREMIVTGDYLTVQIDFEPFWEKPPLFIWMQALSMKVFGVNAFGARFPNALCGVVTLMVLFLAGKRIAGKSFGLLWAFVYAASLLPHFYFKSGIIDPWFNLFIFLGIVFFAEASAGAIKKTGLFALSGLFTGLAVMTKGPAGLLIFILVIVVYQIVTRFRTFPSIGHLAVLASTVLLAGSIWFIAEMASGRYDIIRSFILYQIRLFTTEDAGHGGPFYYHFAVLLFGCFPASLFAIPRIRQNVVESISNKSHFMVWMVILTGIVLLLFSVVKTKIVHYSSLAYFPVTYLAAVNIMHYHHAFKRLPKGLIAAVAGTAFLVAFLLLAAPLALINKGMLLAGDMINDPFAKACLEAEVSWSYADLIPGLVMLSGGLLFLFFVRRTCLKTVISLFFSSLITVSLAALLLAPKVEHHVQRAAIDFYKENSDGSVYLTPLGFKSYAYLFYSNKQKPENPLHNNKEWLFHGDIDKPALFVVRITEAKQHEEWFPHFICLYSKNGFVFYRRDLPKK